MTSYVNEQREIASRWKQLTETLPGAAKAAAPYVGKDGKPGGTPYPFCLPAEHATYNLLPDVRETALALFAEMGIPWHAGVDTGPSNHLLSSQVHCANALTRMVADPERIVQAFGQVLPIDEVVEIEPGRFLTFEFIGDQDYLSEALGGLRTRGAHCTSVDAAFRYRTSSGREHLALVEWKYTESYLRVRPPTTKKDAVRAGRYQRMYEAGAGPLRTLVPFELMLDEPFYQLMRQQLLAHEIERDPASGVDHAWVVHVLPPANLEYQRSIVRPEMRELGETVDEIWARIVRESRYVRVDPTVFLDPAITSEEYVARYGSSATRPTHFGGRSAPARARQKRGARRAADEYRSTVAHAPTFVIRATTARVEVWAGARIPFETGARHPWKKELIPELKAATSALEGDGPLTGTYATTQPLTCDAENTLFTNPGTAAFPAYVGAIRWERDPNSPPPPPRPVADVGRGLHYYRYERKLESGIWEPDAQIAGWKRIPRRLADDGSSRPMWLSLRQALLDGEVTMLAWDLPEDTRFGLRITVHAPSVGPRSAVAASEPLVDGALSALHAGAPLHEAAMVTAVLAPKLGMTPEGVAALVEERRALFVHSPFILQGEYLQMSPCDHLCVVGEVRIVRDPAIASVETSGEIFTVRPKDRHTAVEAPGAGLLAYLDRHLARDVEVAEAAIQWAEALPADNAVGAEHVIRTTRSDGAYVEAYEVPGPEIGELHGELDPARLLAEVAAKKAIIELHSETEDGTCASCATSGPDGEPRSVRFPCRTLLALAMPFARMDDIEEMRGIHGW